MTASQKVARKLRASSAGRSPAISLFSGAGGLDLGAHLAGAKSVACVEMDEDCIQTLRANQQFKGAALLCRDIRSLDGSELLAASHSKRGELALLIGGPPCQPFSKAAYWTSTGEEARRRESLPGRSARYRQLKQYKRRKFDPTSDPRSEMIDEYLRILKAISPLGFVFENVLSIRHPSSRSLFENFLSAVRRLGYAVTTQELNAAQFGVPQIRRRVFVTGLRGKVPPAISIPTHALDNNPKSTLKQAVSAGEALAPFAGNEYFEREECINGRYATHLNEIPPGWNYKALSAWAGHPNPVFEAESRFWHFLLKLHPDKPSWTIAASPGPWTGPFHWNSRRLRIPELAALQSFPVNFRFQGSRRSVQRQVGNAVPPLLAKAVIATVLEPIEGRSRRDDA